MGSVRTLTSTEAVPAVDNVYSIPPVLLYKIVQQTKRCIFNFENENQGIGVQVPIEILSAVRCLSHKFQVPMFFVCDASLRFAL